MAWSPTPDFWTTAWKQEAGMECRCRTDRCSSCWGRERASGQRSLKERQKVANPGPLNWQSLSCEPWLVRSQRSCLEGRCACWLGRWSGGHHHPERQQSYCQAFFSSVGRHLESCRCSHGVHGL